MSTFQDTSRRQVHGLTEPAPARAGNRAVVRWTLRALVEVAILTSLFLLYNLGRVAISGQEALARSHAVLVYQLEAWLQLPAEASVQHLFSSVVLFRAANEYYSHVHFPLMTAFLVWGFCFRPREQYLWARNVLTTMTLLALVLTLTYPMAPPRMFPQWGFLDTMSVFGPSPYDGASEALANQFAAMPSLHIGWALLIALVLVRTGPRLLATLAVLNAGLTVFVVIVTANHWWLDGVVAVLLLLVGVALFPEPRTGRRSPVTVAVSSAWLSLRDVLDTGGGRA